MEQIILGIVVTLLLLLVWKMTLGKNKSGSTVTDEIRDTISLKLLKHKAEELESTKDYDWTKVSLARTKLSELSAGNRPATTTASAE